MRSTKSPSWISRLAGFARKPVPPHVFALDGERLRYARLVEGKGGVELLEHREMELGPEVIAAGPLGGTVREASVLEGRLESLLQGLSAPVNEGSLVLPDTWIRLAFAETEALPRAAAARDEVLRWKLRRLIPFRVEDLRMRGREVPPLAGQEEPRRVLLAFGMDAVLGQLEGAFSRRGIRLGQVSNATLALLQGVQDSLGNLDLGAVLYAWHGGYSALFTVLGEPVIYRHKSLDADAAPEAVATRVRRDLKLTRKFVSDRIDGALLRRVLLVGPEDQEPWWRQWLEEVFEVPVSPLTSLQRFAAAPGSRLPLEELAPMVGAASGAT